MKISTGKIPVLNKVKFTQANVDFNNNNTKKNIAREREETVQEFHHNSKALKQVAYEGWLCGRERLGAE